MERLTEISGVSSDVRLTNQIQQPRVVAHNSSANKSYGKSSRKTTRIRKFQSTKATVAARPKTVQSSILSYAGNVKPISLSCSELGPWSHLNLPHCILMSLKSQNFLKPTAIQEEILQPIMNSTDHVAIAAPTGSGKTLCYGIPILADLVRSTKHDQTEDRIHSLILTPTRELAIQVKDHLLKLCAYTNLKILALVGGISEVKQIRLLKKKPHIIVATPGRLWNVYNMDVDYLSDEYSGISGISSIVLDEADRLFEHAHFNELKYTLEVVRRSIVKSLGLKAGHVAVFDHRTPRRTVEGLSEKRVVCTMEEKDIRLFYLVQTRSCERTLVFANSISSIKRLAALLTELELKPFFLHSKMSQKRRLKNLEVFSGCEGAILLATDVAARGLDIPQVNLVIHYQLPRTVDLYVHRSGRTARGTELTGDTILIVCPEEANLYQSLIQHLNRGRQIEHYNFDDSLLCVYRRIVVTARRIEKLQHLIKRESFNHNWFSRMANECDICLDEDLCEKQDHRETSVASYRMELNDLQGKQKRLKGELAKHLERRALKRQLS